MAERPFLVIPRDAILKAKNLQDKSLSKALIAGAAALDVVFVSHKWFGANPDRNNALFETLKKRLRAEPQVSHLWIDCVCALGTSIEEKMKFIRSIPLYIKQCKSVWSFTHDLNSYRQSAWCAYEMFANGQKRTTVYLLRPATCNRSPAVILIFLVFFSVAVASIVVNYAWGSRVDTVISLCSRPQRRVATRHGTTVLSQTIPLQIRIQPTFSKFLHSPLVHGQQSHTIWY